MQRAAVVAAGNVGVGFARVGEGAVFGEGDAEVEERVIALEPRDVHLREVDRGDFLAPDEVSQFHRRRKGEVLEAGGRSERARGFRVDGLFALRVDGRAGRQRIEDEGGRDGVGQVELADGEVAAALFVEVLEHGGFVFGGDGDGGEGSCLVDHLGRDFREIVGGLIGILGLCFRDGLRGDRIEDAGEEGGGEAEAAGGGEEAAAVEHGKQGTGSSLQGTAGRLFS